MDFEVLEILAETLSEHLDVGAALALADPPIDAVADSMPVAGSRQESMIDGSAPR